MSFEIIILCLCGALFGRAVLRRGLGPGGRLDKIRSAWQRRDRGSQMKLAMTASLSVAAVLTVAKFVAWMITGSVSLLASFVDTTLDAMTSLVNFFAVRRSLRPADSRFRFGHGKAEPLAGMVRSIFIALTAAFLIREAVDRLADPLAVEHGVIGIAVMAFALACMVGLVTFQRSVVRRTGSTAVASDALHYASHAMVNAGVIVSLFLSSELGWTLADPIFAILITVYILRNAWRIGHKAFQQLMDREIGDSERDRIKQAILDTSMAKGVRDLRTRRSGLRVFVQFQLVLDPSLLMPKAFAVTEAVKARVRRILPDSEVMVWQVPATESLGGSKQKRRVSRRAARLPTTQQ